MREFSPSTASRWVACPGSVKLSLPYIDLYDKSESALEGIAAHWVIEQKRLGLEVKVGSMTPKGTVVTDEMIEGAELMLATVPPSAKIEARINCDIISPGMVGVVDAYDVTDDLLTVFDFKFGHRRVEVYRNWQLLTEAVVLAAAHPEVKRVRLVIVQPRCYGYPPVSDWVLTTEELNAEYLPRIKNAAEEARSEAPEVNTGSHCVFCPARAACAALKQVAAAAVDITEQAAVLDLDAESTGSELVLIQDAIERLKARASGLEQMAMLHLSNQQPVKHFTVEALTGKSDWKVDNETLFALGDTLGINLRKDTVPITPNQAVKAGLSKETVKALTEVRSGGSKLVRLNLGNLQRMLKNERK